MSYLDNTELYKIAISSFHDYENQYISLTRIYLIINSILIAGITALFGMHSSADVIPTILILLLSLVGLYICLQMRGALGLVKTKIVYWGKLLIYLEKVKKVIIRETVCQSMGRGPFSALEEIRNQLRRPSDEQIIKEGGQKKVQLISDLYGFQVQFWGLPLFAEKHRDKFWLERIKSLPILFLVLYFLYGVIALFWLAIACCDWCDEITEFTALVYVLRICGVI